MHGLPRQWAESRDYILRNMSLRLLRRDLFKSTTVADSHNAIPAFISAHEEVKKAFERHRLSMDYYFIGDEHVAAGYRPYSAADSDKKGPQSTTSWWPAKADGWRRYPGGRISWGRRQCWLASRGCSALASLRGRSGAFWEGAGEHHHRTDSIGMSMSRTSFFHAACAPAILSFRCVGLIERTLSKRSSFDRLEPLAT